MGKVQYNPDNCTLTGSFNLDFRSYKYASYLTPRIYVQIVAGPLGGYYLSRMHRQSNS